MSTHETLGLMLVRNGAITRPQLYDALRLQRQNGRLLGTCLIDLGYLEADRLLSFLSAQLKIPIATRPELLAAEASSIARLSRDRASSVLALPFGWIGSTLKLAIANGAILPRIPELAMEAGCRIAPHVCLESEVLEALDAVYGQGASQLSAERSREATSQARPLQVRRTAPPLPTPLVLRATGGASAVAGSPSIFTERAKATPPVEPPLERLGLYDAVEALYSARNASAIARGLGRGLLNYFRRVIVLAVGEDGLQVIGHAGVTPQFDRLEAAAVPGLVERVSVAQIVHGTDDPHAPGLTRALRIGRAATGFVATLGGCFLFYADNEDDPTCYEELHDLEMLFKEGETALGLLG